MCGESAAPNIEQRTGLEEPALLPSPSVSSLSCPSPTLAPRLRWRPGLKSPRKAARRGQSHGAGLGGQGKEQEGRGLEPKEDPDL